MKKYIFNFLIYSLTILSVIFFEQVSCHDQSIKQKWIDAGNEFESISWPLKNSFVTFLKQRLESLEGGKSSDGNQLSEQCQNGLQHFMQNLQNNQLWAIESEYIPKCSAEK